MTADPDLRWVTISFPDADARYATRITSLTLASAPAQIDHDTQIMVEIVDGGDPAPVPASPDGPVCRWCGDYLHQPTDAFPDDQRWFDSSGDDECVAVPALRGQQLACDEPASHQPMPAEGPWWPK